MSPCHHIHALYGRRLRVIRREVAPWFMSCYVCTLECRFGTQHVEPMRRRVLFRHIAIYAGNAALRQKRERYSFSQRSCLARQQQYTHDGYKPRRARWRRPPCRAAMPPPRSTLLARAKLLCAASGATRAEASSIRRAMPRMPFVYTYVAAPYVMQMRRYMLRHNIYAPARRAGPIRYMLPAANPCVDLRFKERR